MRSACSSSCRIQAHRVVCLKKRMMRHNSPTAAEGGRPWGPEQVGMVCMVGEHRDPAPIYPSLLGTAATLAPEHHGTATGINQAGLAQPPPCAAFCDSSSLTRRACWGRACPPSSVFITHGSGQSGHFPPHHSPAGSGTQRTQTLTKPEVKD